MRMLPSIKWKLLLIGLVILTAAFLLIRLLLYPWWLTRQYGSELEQAAQRYYQVIYSVEGSSDPDVMAQVSTGSDLNNHVEFRCRGCPSVLVMTAVSAKALWVFEYSLNLSKVAVRQQYGYHFVDPNTRQIRSRCEAEAVTEVLVLKRENGVWKVSGGSDEFGWGEDPVYDTPELRAKYCPSN